MFSCRVLMCGNYLARGGLSWSSPREAEASPRASCPARISRRSSLRSGCGGNRPRSCARVAMPVGHGLGGVLPQRTRVGKLQTIGAENTHEGAHEPPSRGLCERKRGKRARKTMSHKPGMSATPIKLQTGINKPTADRKWEIRVRHLF